MKKGLFRKGLVLGIIVLFVGAGVTPSLGGTVEEKTTVMDSKSGGYIQDLIDNASDGDTINIPSGIYYENIIIDKSINLVGEDKETTVINGSGSGDVVHISADWVNISGFTIENGGNSGIATYWNSYVSDNIISNNQVGIGVSSYNIITNNIISDNNYVNIFMGWMNFYNIIDNNSISNSIYGLFIGSYEQVPSHDNIIVNNSFFNTGLTDSFINNNIVMNNTVNGKPLVYLKDESDMIIDVDAGQIVLIRCDNITVQNQQLCNTTYGIILDGTDNCLILNNTMNSNNVGGIYIDFSSYNSIIGNDIINNGNNEHSWDCSGIFMSSADNNNITGNTISSNNDDGINLHGYSNTIKGNTITSNNGCGIDLDGVGNTFTGNTISNNGYGIYLYSYEWASNTITGNTISNNGYGIYLYSYGGDPSNNTITDNSFFNDGLFVHDSYHNNVKNNTVNDKPLVYLEDESDEIITDAGQIILVNCNNITAENLNLSNTYVGIELWVTDNSKIKNNDCSSNNYGIYLYDSSNNNIMGNNINSNDEYGMYLEDSSNNNFIGNTISNNNDGMYLEYSSISNISGNIIISNDRFSIYLAWSNSTTITDNNISNNGDGINLLGHEWFTCQDNIITDNIITSNNGNGIYLSSFTSNNNITGNNINSNDEYGIYLGLSDDNIIIGNNITSNNNNGLYLDESNSNTIICNNISDNNDGINLIEYSSNNNINRNNINSNNNNGIWLHSSYGNIITDNDISNNDNGIKFEHQSISNIVYHNNLINNKENAIDECNNIWDDGEYGNYWSDYKERYPDAKKLPFKGIWDTPYEIDGGDNTDDCPLINQWPDSRSRTITKTTKSVYSLFHWFLERFPLLEKLLNSIYNKYN